MHTLRALASAEHLAQQRDIESGMALLRRGEPNGAVSVCGRSDIALESGTAC